MAYIPVTARGSIVKTVGTAAVLAAIGAAVVMLVDLDMEKFFRRLDNAPDVLGRMVAVDLSIVPSALLSMLTSVSLALLALVAAVVIALFLSFLAASNIAPNRFAAIGIKGFFAVIRTVPSLVWGLMVIASLGFGNTSGFITILISAVGYLVKTFSGSIEEAGGEIIEAMRATGASWLNIIFHGLLPLCITAFVSWITICFESNVSESISLGIIGVGGIGLLLTQAISTYNYPQVTTIVIIICLLMFAIELGMTKMKNAVKYGSNE